MMYGMLAVRWCVCVGGGGVREVMGMEGGVGVFVCGGREELL